MVEHSRILYLLVMHPVYVLVTVAIFPRNGGVEAFLAALTGGSGLLLAGMLWFYVALGAEILYRDATLVVDVLSGGTGDATAD